MFTNEIYKAIIEIHPVKERRKENNKKYTPRTPHTLKELKKSIKENLQLAKEITTRYQTNSKGVSCSTKNCEERKEEI
jgi:hypothetical protein